MTKKSSETLQHRSVTELRSVTPPLTALVRTLTHPQSNISNRIVAQPQPSESAIHFTQQPLTILARTIIGSATYQLQTQYK